jgi:hypothetical protein
MQALLDAMRTPADVKVERCDLFESVHSWLKSAEDPETTVKLTTQ